MHKIERMTNHHIGVENMNQIDIEMQEIMNELENLISEKYEKMDHEQQKANTELFLEFFDRVMGQINQKS